MSGEDSAKILKEIRALFDDAVPPMVTRTVEEMMPAFEASMKEFAKGTRDLIILELTGEEYVNRAAIKRGIQWSIKNSQNTSTLRLALIVGFGSAGGGAVAAALIKYMGA